MGMSEAAQAKAPLTADRAQKAIKAPAKEGRFTPRSLAMARAERLHLFPLPH